MNYEIITIENFAGITKHIIVDNGDGSFKSFPVDENNPEFIAFIEANPDALAEIAP